MSEFATGPEALVGGSLSSVLSLFSYSIGKLICLGSQIGSVIAMPYCCEIPFKEKLGSRLHKSAQATSRRLPRGQLVPHRRTVLSSDQERMRSSLRLSSAPETPPSWRMAGPICWPVAASHRRTVLSDQ